MNSCLHRHTHSREVEILLSVITALHVSQVYVKSDISISIHLQLSIRMCVAGTEDKVNTTLHPPCTEYSIVTLEYR